MRLIKIKYVFAYFVIVMTLITFLLSFNLISTGFEHRYVYINYIDYKYTKFNI